MAMRSFAPMTLPVEGAWVWPYTGVLMMPVAATAAATVADFLMKSRRDCVQRDCAPADEEVVG